MPILTVTLLAILALMFLIPHLIVVLGTTQTKAIFLQVMVALGILVLTQLLVILQWTLPAWLHLFIQILEPAQLLVV
jgi:hypothetical protein